MSHTERAREILDEWAERPGAAIPYAEAEQIIAALLAREAALRTVAEHLRHCRECGETDVENCTEGRALWGAAFAAAPTEAPAPQSYTYAQMIAYGRLCWSRSRATMPSEVEPMPAIGSAEEMDAARVAEAPAPAEAPAVPVAVVRYQKTGGNVGLAWTAAPHEACDHHPRDGEPLYSAAALAAARESGRREGREEAAKVAESVAKQYGPAGCHPIERAVNAIRALLTQPAAAPRGP